MSVSCSSSLSVLCCIIHKLPVRRRDGLSSGSEKLIYKANKVVHGVHTSHATHHSFVAESSRNRRSSSSSWGLYHNLYSNHLFNFLSTEMYRAPEMLILLPFESLMVCAPGSAGKEQLTSSWDLVLRH